jgi:hypothetical protein
MQLYREQISMRLLDYQYLKKKPSQEEPFSAEYKAINPLCVI